MKANQFAKNDEAQVGIGTMIVFISTVLVAAVAAGVLVSVGSDLQSQSKATGAEAKDEVSNSLALKRAYARDVVDATAPVGEGAHESDTDGNDNVADEFHLFVSLAAGAKAVDLSEAEIILDTGGSISIMQYVDLSGGAAAAPAADGSYFTVERLGSESANSEVQDGDLVNIRILGDYATVGGWGARLNVPAGSEVGITVSLPTGSPLFGTFNMPAVMDNDYEQLY